MIHRSQMFTLTVMTLSFAHASQAISAEIPESFAPQSLDRGPSYVFDSKSSTIESASNEVLQIESEAQLRSYLIMIRDLGPSRLLKSDGNSIQIKWNQATSFSADGSEQHQVYDELAEIIKTYNESVSEPRRIEISSQTTSPLSFFGPVFSYFSMGESYSENAAHPSSYNIAQSINVATKRPVSLEEIAEERSIIQALQKDKWLAKNITARAKSQLAQAKSIVEINRALEHGIEVCEASWHGSPEFHSGLSSFAILDYYPLPRGEAAVRIFLGPQAEACRYALTQLGLVVKIKEPYLSSFERAYQKDRSTSLFFKDVKF